MRETAAAPVRASRTPWTRRAARAALLSLAAAGLLSLSGAFGSQGAPPLVRVIYWLCMMATGSMIGIAASEVFIRRGWIDGPTWRVGVGLTLAIAAPLTVAVWFVTSLFFGRGLDPHALPGFVLPVLALSGALTALNLMLGRSPVMTHAPAPPTSQEPAPPLRARFLDRMPPKLRGAELHAVEAEDHYLRLHTSRGSDLILFRLADAIAELEGLEGAQTHRSWWVARAAVQSASKADGRASLRLPGGVEAPVSRTYARVLRERGWF